MSGGVDMGLGRNLPEGATFIGEDKHGHLLFAIGEVTEGDDDWFAELGTPKFCCVRCGGRCAGLPNDECRGHHPHETPDEAKERLLIKVGGLSPDVLRTYRRTWGTLPTLKLTPETTP